MFEIFECRRHILENRITRIFLQYVMNQTKTAYEFFSMFVCHGAFGNNCLCHLFQIMMTSEIKSEYIFNLAFLHFCDMKVIGMFFLGSVQIFFIGLLGEYISNINIRVMNRPLVVEEERINFEKESKKG